MSRSPRLAPITLTSYAAYLLLAACSDGAVDGDSSNPHGNTAGTFNTTPGGAGTASVGGSSAGLPHAPTAGQGLGGAAPVAGAGVGGAKGGSGGSNAGSGGSPMTAGSSGSDNPPACGDDGDIMCGGSCVDPSSNEQHCGACGKVCGSNQECESGSCECSGDLSPCSNSCVDLDADAENCGSCGKACGAGQQCEDGSCACTGELTLCGSACVNTDTDTQNCGGCGDKCASGQTCSNGACSGGASGGTTCSSISDFGVVSSTIVVKNGETYDGKCRRYRADPDELGDGSQEEGQKPVFLLENGGRLINVVLGAPAADGIHTEGNVTLENVTWEDVGEDALTIKESGTVVLNGGSAKNGADKIFQINAASTFRVSNFKASNAGKFIRQLGGSTFKTQVFIDKCDIADMDEAIFRTDSSSSTVSMTNTRYHAIGESLFIGVSSGNVTQSNNTQY